MNPSFIALLEHLPAPPEGSFSVARVPGAEAYYAGRDHLGFASLLVCSRGAGSKLPVQLAGISAQFGMSCRIVEPGQPERVEALSCISCLTTESGTERYFASIVDVLIGVLGPAPSTATLAEALDRLVSLFQKLRQPPRKSVVGLVGELLIIHAAHSPSVATGGWRTDPDERYDFCVDRLRIEAKAAGNRRRTHSLSFEQAEPPYGTVGLLASVFVEKSSGGTSVSELISAIENQLGSYNDKIKIRSVVAETLGHDLLAALGWRFDLALASSSLEMFDLRQVPAIRGELPDRVSSVRFTTDLSTCMPVAADTIGSLTTRARQALPRRINCSTSD